MSLVPGYKLVENFGPDDEYETVADGDDLEETVSYVTLDISGLDPTLLASSSSYRLIGTDTPTPFLQLSGVVLKGEHKELLGTELLFADAKDNADHTKRSLSLIGTTEQRIKFDPVELIPKGQAQDQEEPKHRNTKALSVERVAGAPDNGERPKKKRSDRTSVKKKGKEKETAVDDPGEDKMEVAED